MAYDDLFEYLGEFGRYQRRIYVLLCLTGISSALHKLAGVFLQAKTKHRCQLPYENDNASYELRPEIINMTYPWDSGINDWSSCEMINTNFSDQYFDRKIPGNSSIACSSWIYDKSTYQSSTVIEFDLVCDNAWLRAVADSLFMFGDVLGSITFGYLSDRFGRKPTFLIALILQLVGGILVAISPEYITFMISRLIVGSTASGAFLVGYVIAMEMVGPSKRLFAGVACQFFFTGGYILTAGFAYFIHSWRLLQISYTVPAIIFLTYWWFIPESTRWLVSKGRVQEAKDLLIKAAKENKVRIPDNILDSALLARNDDKGQSSENQHTPSMLDLLRYPGMRRRSLNIFFNWFANNSTYYGLSWNTAILEGNDYLNFVISGLVEVPAYSFLLLTLNRWGRKTILCGCMLLGGVALLLTMIVPTDWAWLMIALAMTGKLAVTASYGTIYIFTAEQFPTVIRNVALGASSTCARAGGITAPYINLLSEYWLRLPLLVFGVLISTGGFLAMQLPETRNKKLPDTIEEGEKFGKKTRTTEDLGTQMVEFIKNTGSGILSSK